MMDTPSEEREHKYSVANLQRRFAALPEFQGAHISESTLEYISDRLRGIEELKNSISHVLMKEGVIDKPLTIRMGTEIEFYNIAGQGSFKRRTRQLAQANDSDNFEGQLAKDDSFMPKKAQVESLRGAFANRVEKSKTVHVDREPACRTQIAIEPSRPDPSHPQLQHSRIAMFQHEIVTPPRVPEGLAFWLPVIGQRIIDKAPDYDLERSEIITSLHDMLSSSLHFTISLIGEKDGKEVNILSRDSFSEEKGKSKKNPKEVSQLALNIAHAMNDFQKNHTYIFAPTENAYARFGDSHFVGTSFIGFMSRRKRFEMGTAMFRGEGRETFREEDDKGVPDKGPLRLEFRLPDVGCMGHPNKRAYPDQLAAPFDVVESILQMFQVGIDRWDKEQQIKREGKPVPVRSEHALYEHRFDLPKTAGGAATLLREAKDSHLTPERKARIITRALKQQKLDEFDHSPFNQPGQHHDRSGQLAR